MALTNQEKTSIRAIIARDGGLGAVLDALRDLVIADRKAADATTLGSAVTVTVSSWTAPAAYIAAVSDGAALPSIIADITAAWAAHDATVLGPLFVQLLAANKKHFNL